MNVYRVCRATIANYLLTRWETGQWIYVRADNPIEAGQKLSRRGMVIKWTDIREVEW